MCFVIVENTLEEVSGGNAVEERKRRRNTGEAKACLCDEATEAAAGLSLPLGVAFRAICKRASINHPPHSHPATGRRFA